jgi:hypothetical protein
MELALRQLHSNSSTGNTMPDLTSQYLPTLRQNRLPDLYLGDDLLYPAYEGFSILNLPASICRWLGRPEIGARALDGQILDSIGRAAGGDGYRRVILVLMDALALHRLQRWMQNGCAPIWRRLAEAGLLAPLTSITPSTTSSALTTLWSGCSVAEHAITGYEMWMKEYGIVTNTILHTPIAFQNDTGGLERAGFEPERFHAFTTLGAHLAAHGVKTYAFQHYGIAHSGLSRMLFKEVAIQGFGTAPELWINLRQLLENKPDERLYAWVYWGEVDHFGHFYGPDDERTAAEFAVFSSTMEKYFLAALSDRARQDTLLVLTADHGQIATPVDGHYDLRNHPGLMRRLHIQPTGEHRLSYLYIRPGQTEAVREYLERTWPGQFYILDAPYAIQGGLFGPGAPHPDLLDRVGDTIVVARGNAYFWWANKDNILLGRHGGLHPEEMLVPLLAARL